MMNPVWPERAGHAEALLKEWPGASPLSGIAHVGGLVRARQITNFRTLMLSLPRKQIIGAAGVTLAVMLPFVNFQFVYDRLEVSATVLTIIIKLALVTVLAILAFGLQRRSLKFFRVRGFGWYDLGAMFAAIFSALVLVFVATQLLKRFNASGSIVTGETDEIPLAVGVVSALAAGISEEFIYRGFIIEELGELIRNRWLAGAFSALVFGLSHFNSYGWSIGLLYPGLIGLVITVLYLWRNNLLICMLMHVSFDVLNELFQRS
jgi:membrane protease YdiL (CAAX protease family)